MSYSIIDIKSISPKAINYFFDANIWQIIINSSPTQALSKEKQPYIDFFDAICNLRTTLLASGKKNPVLPGIIVSPLLISEIFNTYMRIAFSEWKDEMIAINKFTEKEASKKDYKKDYRKEAHYDNAVTEFKSEFLARKEFVIIMDDVGQVDPFDILKNFPANSDFNDVYYYTFCYENKMPIVTNDGDFLFPGVDIITNLDHLLKLK